MNKPLDNLRLACLDIHSPLYLKTEDSLYSGGDIKEMHALIDFAANAGFKLIALTPIQDTVSPCPYMGVSVFSYNPIFLDVTQFKSSKKLVEIEKSYLKKTGKRKTTLVDYKGLREFKIKVLEELFNKEDKEKFIQFNDFGYQTLAYAVFVALKKKFKKDWMYWPEFYKKGKVNEIIATHPELHKRIKFNLFVQETLRQQWKELSDYASSKEISFIVDKPIYPVHNSAEVWANQKLFYLNPNGSLKWASGCDNPGDPFGKQYWGHAVYRFKEIPDLVIDYFVQTIRHLSKISSAIRLDHTLALVWKYYCIDPETKEGFHRPAIKSRLLTRLAKEFPNLIFIAEDSGFVSPANVDRPLAKFNIPGMRCPQWQAKKRYYDVATYPEMSFTFTSNHDTETLFYWWKKLKKTYKSKYLKQIRERNESEELSWEIIKLVFASKSKISSISLRDLTDDFRRYNLPGVIRSQNWKTRIPCPIEKVNWDKISNLIMITNRSK